MEENTANATNATNATLRLKETITILKKLTRDLGLPYESEEVQAIKYRMSEFVKTGDAWSGVVPLPSWERDAVLDMRASGKIELTLRAWPSLKKKQVKRHFSIQ